MRASATNMKLFHYKHSQAATFPMRACVCAIGNLVLFSFEDYQQEQLGKFRRQKWSFLNRQVNDNLCKKIFSFGYFFFSFIIWINNFFKVRCWKNVFTPNINREKSLEILCKTILLWRVTIAGSQQSLCARIYETENFPCYFLLSRTRGDSKL